MSACIDENRLADLFTSERDELVAEVDRHVAGCERCRVLVATYARLFACEADGEPPPAPRVDLPSPTVLARAWAEGRLGRTVAERWRLERVVGIGGSAVVFEAVHRTGSRVAVKMLRPEHAPRAALAGRFLREAYVANEVDHPGVPRVLDDGTTDDGLPFLVMDLLEGETLRQRVVRGGPLGADQAIDLALAVLSVLERAHARGVVHRDLKPDNVFFEASGAVRVLDFGIARSREKHGEELTETGLGMGTSAYMPPEQARGDWDRVGPRTDLWALAATLVFALARRPPHVADNAQKTLILAATKPAPRVSEIAADTPPPLARALDHALSFDPEHRPPDARAMADALARSRAASAPTDASSRRRSSLALALGLALAVTAAVAVLAVRAPAPTPAAAPPEGSEPSSLGGAASGAPPAPPPPATPAVASVASVARRPSRATTASPRPPATTPPRASAASASATPSEAAPLASAAPASSDDESEKLRRRH